MVWYGKVGAVTQGAKRPMIIAGRSRWLPKKERGGIIEG